MKKIQLLIVVAIATFLFGNLYAENIVLDLNSNEFKNKAFGNKNLENYTVSLNNKFTPNKVPKNNNKLLAEEEIVATWLTNEEPYNALGTQSGSAMWGPTMVFTKDDLAAFRGIYSIKQINDVQFHLYPEAVSAIQFCAVLIWVKETGSDTYQTYQQEVTNFVGEWNKVKLETPITISNVEEVMVTYIVAFPANVYPCSISSEVVEKQILMFVFDPSSGDVANIMVSNSGSWLMRMGATAEVYPYETNARLQAINCSEYIKKGDKLKFDCVLKNLCSNNITSIEISYKIGDEAVQTISGDIEAVKPGGTFIITSPEITLPSNHTAGNTYPITATVIKVNGTDDEDESDNTQSSQYTIPHFWPTKRVFGEEFTGTWCGWCPRGWVYMEELKEQYPDEWIGVAVHYEDPMGYVEYNKEISTIVNGSGYPNGTVDRYYDGDPSNFENAFNAAKENFGFANLQIINYSYDKTTRKMDFDVEATFAVAMKEKDLRFMGIITEDDVRGTTKGYNQVNYYAGGGQGEMGGFENKPDTVLAADMYYNDVARAVLGTPFGAVSSLPASIDANSKHTYHFSYTIPAEYNEKMIDVIAVVLNNTDSTVCNAVRLNKPTSIAADKHVSLNSIYPNPTKGDFTIDLKETAKVSIFTVDGIKLFEENREEGLSNIKINASAGTYILRTETVKGSATTKFVVE